MTPRELYEITPESTTYDINIAFEYFRGSHFPEVCDSSYYFSEQELSKNNRITIKIYKDVNLDERRIWRLMSAWLDNHPVMVMQNAGREGDDHIRRFITDIDRYNEMVEFIAISMMNLTLTSIPDVVDIDTDIEDLTEFYDMKL